ncbi:uncharacterized protein RCC_08625 [Ramularia collo-cygni]|uniref:Rhodopsin domain-containing protein n=1 Tax=Ramularia collo-cygni TaxID=112498 RepID=A0A2D3VMQ5_9PEZI|nr:uncharacterized protein RCC_08625 [Ramularia collo-cygni]CZT22918.1 uncharacterized protein RCC_08625 [Ramularia collo-cygni]
MNGHASGTSVVAVTVTFTALAATFVACRTYARLRIARNAGSDDVSIVFAMLFALGTTITMLFQVKYGMGRRQASLSQDESISMLKAFYVSIWTYNLSLCCTKVAILLQYLRVFSPMKTFRMCCFILLTVVVIYAIYAAGTAIFACSPIAFFWDHRLEGKCLPRFPIWFANAAINIVTDIVIVVLPIPVMSDLELPTRTKRALMTVFLLGGFTCIVSILRLQSLFVISRAQDVSWNNGMAAIWSNIEINTAIMCSCLPTMRCLFPRIFKSRMSQPRSYNSGEHRAEESNWLQTLLRRLNPRGNDDGSSLSQERLEAGRSEGKTAFPLNSFQPGDEHGRSQAGCKAAPKDLRGKRASRAGDDRILVCKEIDQEVEIRDDVADDHSTKDLIIRQPRDAGVGS